MRERMRVARRAAREAVRAAGRASGSTVSVARRRNIIVTGSVGGDGAVRVASSTQYAPIVQDGRAGRGEGEVG